MRVINTRTAQAIQNPPYEVKAVAPNVFPTKYSPIPAKSWHMPPTATA